MSTGEYTVIKLVAQGWVILGTPEVAIARLPYSCAALSRTWSCITYIDCLGTCRRLCCAGSG